MRAVGVNTDQRTADDYSRCQNRSKDSRLTPMVDVKTDQRTADKGSRRQNGLIKGQ